MLLNALNTKFLAESFSEQFSSFNVSVRASLALWPAAVAVQVHGASLIR